MRHRHACCACQQRRAAFTLLELLISIAIIALLIGLLMPALGRARERARATVCTSNLRSITQATAMYVDDDSSHLIPWYTFPQTEGCDLVSKYTPWVFGGFTAPTPKDADLGADSSLYPVHVRPLNKLLAPTAEGFGTQISVFKCPSDRSSSVPAVDASDPAGRFELIEDRARPSWAANGSSYTLNTRFMDEYVAIEGGEFLPKDANRFGRKLAPHMIGGKASVFVLWAETDFYNTTCGVDDETAFSKAPALQNGLHQEFAKWSVAFADGHVEYKYFDTRLPFGPSWTVWQPR